MTLTPPQASGGLKLLAATPVGGFALQNATPTIISFTFPNDGQLHRVLVLGATDVTVAETGGAITWSMADPLNNPKTAINLKGGSQAVGVYKDQDGAVVGAGSTVAVQQNTALTAGTSTTWQEIWGS